MDIILNRVAIWQPQIPEGLTVRRHSIGTIFKRKDSDIYEKSKTPLYRFAKNYEKEGERFCLFSRVEINDPTLVEKDLDQIADKLDPDYIRKIKVITSANPMDFEYTDYYLFEEEAAVLEGSE